MGANRLARAREIDCGEFLDFFEGQPERPHTANDLHTPEGFFVKEPVVALAAPKCIEQPELFIFAQGFNGHASVPGELSDGHWFCTHHGYTAFGFVSDLNHSSSVRVRDSLLHSRHMWYSSNTAGGYGR